MIVNGLIDQFCNTIIIICAIIRFSPQLYDFEIIFTLISIEKCIIGYNIKNFDF